MTETEGILEHLESIASWVNGVNDGWDIIACPGYQSDKCPLEEDSSYVGPCLWMARVSTSEYRGLPGPGCSAVLWDSSFREESHYFIMTSAHRRFATEEDFLWQEASRETYNSTDWPESRCKEADCPKCAHPSEPGLLVITAGVVPGPFDSTAERLLNF